MKALEAPKKNIVEIEAPEFPLPARIRSLTCGRITDFMDTARAAKPSKRACLLVAFSLVDDAGDWLCEHPENAAELFENLDCGMDVLKIATEAAKLSKLNDGVETAKKA